MTLQEVAKRLGRSECTIKYHFNRTQLVLAKQGIMLRKTGRGDNVDYTISYVKVSKE